MRIVNDDPMRSVVDYDRDEKRTASRHVPVEQEPPDPWDQLSPEERAQELQRRRRQ